MTPNPVGRPRTVSPPPDELENLGIEMVEWLKKNPKALHISEWSSLVKFYTDSVWETMIRRPEFVGYYEQAKRIIGKKYLDKTSNVRDGISQRWQRVYFKDLKKQEDEDAEEAIERQNKLTSTLIPPLQDHIDKDHEIMKLKYKIEQLEKNADKS